MTIFFLIRHARCEPVGRRLAGCAPGIRLTEAGRLQAEALGLRLRATPLDAVVTSPLERARETAEALASGRGLEPEVSPALTEIDVGAWTGCAFDALAGDETWQRFNRFRSGTRCPSGESMLEVAARAVAELERLRGRYPEGRVAVVTHADVLRAAVAHYLGIPLDLSLRLEFSPASVTVLALGPWDARLLGLNHTGELPNL